MKYVFLLLGILAFLVLRDDVARDAAMRSWESIIVGTGNFLLLLTTGGPHG